MLKTEISTLESHIQMLGRMSTELFELWDDNSSRLFKDKCVEVIKKEWRTYASQVSALSGHLKSVMQELDNTERSIKKLQNGEA